MYSSGKPLNGQSFYSKFESSEIVWHTRCVPKFGICKLSKSNARGNSSRMVVAAVCIQLHSLAFTRLASRPSVRPQNRPLVLHAESVQGTRKTSLTRGEHFHYYMTRSLCSRRSLSKPGNLTGDLLQFCYLNF